MPRKLPWLNSSPASKTKVKSTPGPDNRTKSKTNGSDCGISPGSPLPTSIQRKRRADPEETASSVHRQYGADRALSSSPAQPPEDHQRPVEPMRKALNKYDLRDDEWMMVEDEFLQTAKSFTRHQHLAEYERLKKDLRSRKDVARPVVANAKPSEERKLRMRIEAQRKAQKQALEDVAEETSEGSADDLDAPVRASFSQQRSSYSHARQTSELSSTKAAGRTATRPSLSGPSSTDPKPSRSIQSFFGKKPQDLKEAEASNSKAQSTDTKTPSLPSSKLTLSHPFPKPPLPSKRQPIPSRSSRASIFDLLDDIDTPSTSSKSKSKSTPKPSHPPRFKPISLLDQMDFPSRTSKPPHRKPFTLLDDMDFPSKTPLSKETTDRLSKRKAEQKKKDEGLKKKSLGIDEIPTFLV